MRDRVDPGDPARQEQTVERSPRRGGRPDDPADEHSSAVTTQTSGGLGAGDPAGGPQSTPERRRFERTHDVEPHVRSGNDEEGRR